MARALWLCLWMNRSNPTACVGHAAGVFVVSQLRP